MMTRFVYLGVKVRGRRGGEAGGIFGTRFCQNRSIARSKLLCGIKL